MGSYIFNYITHSIERYKVKTANRPKIKTITNAIIDKASHELTSRGLDHFFLVFSPDWVEVSPIETKGWRLGIIEQALQRNSAPYILSRDILKAHFGNNDYERDLVFQKENGHPKPLQNKIVAKAISHRILTKEVSP